MKCFDNIEQDVENWQNRVSEMLEEQKRKFCKAVKSGIEYCVLSNEPIFIFYLDDFRLLTKDDIMPCLTELYDKKILRNIDFQLDKANKYFCMYLDNSLIR